MNRKVSRVGRQPPGRRPGAREAMDTDPVLRITCNRFPARDDLRDITRRNTGFVAARRMERRMSIKKQVTVNAALRRGKYLGAIGAALLLGGCVAVGPDYRPPTLDAPPQWQSTLTNEQAAGSMDSAVLSRWWANLGDPVLTTLMEQALAGNLDLDQARHRVREARASRMGASAGYFPIPWKKNTISNGSRSSQTVKPIDSS